MDYVSWEDVRDEVRIKLEQRDSQAKLFHNIDKLAVCLTEAGLPPRLGRISYPFGSFIVDDSGNAPPLRSNDGSVIKKRKRSQLCLPSGECIPDMFQYAIVPLGLLLENAVEVFYPDNVFAYTGNRCKGKKTHRHPVKVIRAGEFLGLFETLHHFTDDDPIEYSPWCVVAGARSIQFTLNPVRNFETKLKEVVRRFGNPNAAALRALASTTSDWEIAKIIAASMEPDWNVQLLLFAEDWFRDDPDRLDLRKQKTYQERKGEIRQLRMEFEHFLYQAGWRAASPLFTEANVGDFYQEWNKLTDTKTWATNIGKQAGRLAFELFEIDRGLRPVLVDVCYAFSKEGIEQGLYDSLAEVAPIEALITALTELSNDLKADFRITAFLPHELCDGVISFHTTYDTVAQEPMFSDMNNEGKGDLLDTLNVLLSGPGVFKVRRINPNVLLWVANERIYVRIDEILGVKDQEVDERYRALPISTKRAHALLARYEKHLEEGSKRSKDFHETINRLLNLRLHMKGSIAIECMPLKDPL